MVVAVTVVRMMQMATNKVINVVAVRNALVSAGRAMSVFAAVRLAIVIGRAGIWIGAADGY